MQQDQYEVLFCDLCGTSVPVADLDRGAAIRHHSKTIGACCLVVLRQGDSPLASLGESPAAAAPARAGTGDRHALTIGIAVLAALAAATIFLDQKISRVATTQDEQHGRVSTAMQSDSEVLLKLDMAMDGTARKADVEALTERVSTLDGAVQLHQEQMRQQVDQLRQGLAAVQQDTRQLNSQGIDYRPLFEDLRQQLQRQGAMIAELRTNQGSPAAPAPQSAPPAEPAKPDAPAAPGVPEALLAQIKKLGDADAAVRFEAVDALLTSKNLAVLPSLLPMARDSDAFVRRLTIEGLRDFKHVDSVDALLVALGDNDPDVRETAWSSLKKLTGQKIAFDAASPSKETRQRGQQRWQEWWDKNKATFGS
jgi:hypothetical protein